ncbi:MAG: YHYH protein, partial [Pseudomonadota bacterium]
DNHHAHTQPDGRYHYHGNPNALFDDKPGPDGSPLIGFAADGFPVYGSYFKDETGKVRKAVPGYTLKAGSRPSGDGNPGGAYDGLYRSDYEFTGAGDLDECNGMTINGQYAYYVTDAYPWIVACLRGTPDASFDKPR